MNIPQRYNYIQAQQNGMAGLRACTSCRLNKGRYVHWTLRIVWLGSVAKLIFMATEHHGIKEEARQTLSMVVCETVNHKSMLRNHHTIHKVQTHMWTHKVEMEP